MKSNIFITGFSGSGKTTVAKEVARRLGWSFVDTDDHIVRAAGDSIETIFAEMGEVYFRRLEHDALREISNRHFQVVSTGGGIVVDESNCKLMEQRGVIVCLEARPKTVYERLEKQRDGSPSQAVRPMLTATDSLKRIHSLKNERQANYALAHWTVHTDYLTTDQVATEVVKGWGLLSKHTADATHDEDDLATVVRTSSGNYPVWVGWGIMEELGERLRKTIESSMAYVITDEGACREARRAQVALESAGVPTHMFVLPSGERSKDLRTAKHIYRWLADRRAERGHLVLAVGGGVIGDVSGFVAATFLRGMFFAQVPTTLLAMMDAAIGGKVAVDLPQGKNLVGAFHQPKFVLADVETLQTLPKRELTAGWAEAIKHGLIFDKELLTTFENQRESIQALEQHVATNVIRRSVAIKARVVSSDERDTLGLRILLNYGHTIGHAIEVATGYSKFHHGEAVSVGMMGAAYISHGMGMMSAQEVERQRILLSEFGLPLACKGVDVDLLNEAILLDKKTSKGVIHWVLLDGIGRAVTRNDVPAELVQETLERLAQ